MSNNEKNSEIENRIEISLIIDENHSTVIQLDLKKATDNSIAKLCTAICRKYNLSEKIQIKLMNQIKKEVQGIKLSSKKEVELGMVKRLYYESVNKSKEKKAILAKVKQEKDEKDLCEFNFTPKINKSSNKLHDRKYLKIEDRLYYDYKKSSHKKGFEKYFDTVQLSGNSISDGFKKPMAKSSRDFFKQSNKDNLNSADEHIDVDFTSNRSQSKKFTFYAGGSQRKNNFLNENQIENKNLINSNLYDNRNTNTPVTPTRKTNEWGGQDSSKNLYYNSNVANNLKKISSVSVERMEQTASFPFIQENNNSKNQNQNLAPQQLYENNNQGTMKAFKTQRAITADYSNNLNTGCSHVASNNFINTFSPLVNNEDLNQVSQINQPKAVNVTNISDHDLLAKKNNYLKQFTFSNNNIVAAGNNHNYERKASNNYSNNGNTYTEKYEKSIGKNSNTNVQLLQSNNTKAPSLLENIQENNINKSNIFQQEREVRDVNISQNNILTDSSKMDEKNNLKELLFSKGIKKRSNDLNENENEENLLYSESYGITNAKVAKDVNKSNTERNKNSTSTRKTITKGAVNRPNTTRVHTKRSDTQKLKNSRDITSNSHVQNIQAYSTWYDRLHKSKEDYRTAKEEHIQKQINKVCPFRPKITELSRKILRTSKSTENHNQFLDRLANSKRSTGVFKDSKLILFSRSNSHSINTFSGSKSLTSGRRNFNHNTESILSPIYATQISREIISQKEKEKEKDSINKRNYASTVQSDNVESEININNSSGKLYLNTENNKCNNTYNNKSKHLVTSRTEKNLRETKKIRALKEEKNLMEMSYQYFENKQKSKKILQDKCNQSIMKFKKNNLKELFEMIVSGHDLNVLPNHIKEKLLIPVCNMMNQEKLEFNFQNFYVVADEILNNFF